MAGGFAGIEAAIANYGITYGAQGGAFFDGTGDSYSQSPGFSPSFNPLGGGSNFSVGGSAGIQVMGWGN